MTKLTLFRNADAEAFPAGTVIFAEGDPADDMYVVKSGDIDISVRGQFLRTVGADEVFGEMALVDSSPRSATATARSDAELVRVDRRRFEFMVQQTPGFATAVLATMAERLRTAKGST
jgi:CRP-like cAMP-binding protein